MTALQPTLRRDDDLWPTGLPWLEQVPATWELVPTRALLRQRKVTVGNRHTDYALLSLTKQGVIVRDVDSGKGKFSADMSAFQEVRPGDMVFCLFDVPETPRTVGLSHHAGMITGAYTIFEPVRPELAEFLDLYFRVLDDRKLLSPLYSGLRNTIPKGRLLATRTPVPPENEREAIVKYAWHVQAQVARLVRARGALINLVREELAAQIQELLLQGVSGTTTRPYPGAWFKALPEHWEVLRCRYLFKEVDERSPAGAEQALSMSQRRGLVPSEHLETRTLVAESMAGGKLVQVGDLVLNRLKAHLGVFALSSYSGVVSPDYTVLRPKVHGGVRYFEEVLRSPACRRELRMRAKGIVEGFWRLYTDDFYDIRLPVPPEEERLKIEAEVEQLRSKANAAIEKAEREVLLLREYAQRVLFDLATGAVDVREAAAGLSSVGAQDAETLDETSADVDVAGLVAEELSA